MSISYITFDLQDGFIMNWLAVGPQAMPLDPQKTYATSEAKLQAARDFYDENSGIHTPPVERGPLHEGVFTIGNFEGHWEYLRCREDRLVDHSTSLPACSYLRSWAYTQLSSSSDQQVRFVISSYGPVDIWVNKKLVCHADTFSEQLHDISFNASLKRGKNQLLVRFCGIAAPGCALAFALRLDGEGISVHIPTLIPSVERRNELEEINEQVSLERDVYTANDKITLRWPEQMGKPAAQDVRLQTPSGRIYGQAEDIGKPGAAHVFGIPASLPYGPYQIVLMPRSWEYYEKDIRITKALNLWAMGMNRFSDKSYGALEERRREALVHASRFEGEVFAEIARAALQGLPSLDHKVFEQAGASINQQQHGSEIHLLGLLGMVSRFGSQPDFPAHIQEQVKDCALNFTYRPGASESCSLDFEREDHQLIFAACAVLAGQLYPDSHFTSSGLTGQQQRQKGEVLALAWMQERAAYGFAAWDAKASYAHVLAALSHLVDLADTEAIWELASVLMDKMFYSIALNSHKGVFGSTQGSASAVTIKSGLLEETSGITRLMWGMGIYNHHLAGLVSLACMEKYELPPIIADIAAGVTEDLWNREQQAVDAQVVNTVTYRTPEYMLSSAQDYHPDERGSRQHIWQATLSPQSIVFVNHPGCNSESDAHLPGFWAGNGILPRVAQWKDTLIALYDLPQNAWMEFTHAFFPTAEFDEFRVQGNTAFARKGDGYLALTASQGLTLVTTGPAANRELRSPGKQNIWLCRMGRAALDGAFAEFQEKIQTANLSLAGLNITCQTLRGDTLSFGWDAPFLVNGEIQPLSGFKHYENAFTSAELPCKGMEIKTADYLLRLNFDTLSE